MAHGNKVDSAGRAVYDADHPIPEIIVKGKMGWRGKLRKGIKGWWDNAFDDTQSLDKFKANFDGGARANRFNVDIMGPEGIALQGLRCESVSMPGRQLTHEGWSAYGPLQHMPYNIDHDGNQVTMTFRCDSTFFDRLILETWQTAIFTAGAGDSYHPIFNYYQDYIGTVQIDQQRKDGSPALRYELKEAYPIAYAAQELNSTTTDDIMKFSVTFAFRTFETSYHLPDSGGLFGKINKGRKYLDLALNTLKLGSRFNKKAGKWLNKLESLDTALARGAQTYKQHGGG